MLYGECFFKTIFCTLASNDIDDVDIEAEDIWEERRVREIRRLKELKALQDEWNTETPSVWQLVSDLSVLEGLEQQ